MPPSHGPAAGRCPGPCRRPEEGGCSRYSPDVRLLSGRSRGRQGLAGCSLGASRPTGQARRKLPAALVSALGFGDLAEHRDPIRAPFCSFF